MDDRYSARGCPSRGHRGSVIVLIAISLVLLIALAALTIDVGWLFVQESRFRGACNSAATAAAAKCAAGASADQARTSAKGFALACGVTLSDQDIQINPQGNNTGLVCVSHQEPVGLFFGAALGTSSARVGYTVWAIAGANTSSLYSDPLTPLAASGLVPLYIPHADLLPVLQGSVSTKGQLANLIFNSSQGFVTGHQYLLKAGASFHSWLQGIVGPCGSSQEGGVHFRGQSPGADVFASYFEQGFAGSVAVGDVLSTEMGTMAGPTSMAVTFRVNQDPASTFGATGQGIKPLSARMVVVPIANAVETGPDDAGTGVPNLRNIGYYWDGSINVKVIGFAQFFLDPSSTSDGEGVVTGIFVRYVGRPPSGQNPG